ncbi:hypothetical protein XENOCAPTIV_000771, partial [Xenoophorus captivus]
SWVEVWDVSVRRLMTASLLHNEKLVEEDQISTTLSGESMEEPESEQLLLCGLWRKNPRLIPDEGPPGYLAQRLLSVSDRRLGLLDAPLPPSARLQSLSDDRKEKQGSLETISFLF